MNEVLINIDNMSKKFSKSFKGGARVGIKKALNGVFSRRSGQLDELKGDEFWALRNVCLKVKRGEAIGFLGKNGAGKSTLLKHVAGIYLPDKGRVEVVGHVEGLIELGAGFHPLLSGRDNIKQRCSVLGLNIQERDRIIKDIISFSELEEFIDMPVQNYSSGMKARLGFASAVLVQPDILLVDEALSVGDFEFQQKCLAKINEIKKSCAVIFVSHGIQAMKMFCDKGVVFEKGSIIYSGDIDDAAEFYLNLENKSQERSKGILDNKFMPKIFKSIHGEEFINNEIIKSFDFFWCDKNLIKKDIFSSDEDIYAYIKVRFYEGISSHFNKLILAMPFWAEKHYVTSLSSDVQNLELEVIDEKIEYLIRINNIFNKSELLACVAFHDGPEYFIRKFMPTLKIVHNNPREHGIFRIKYEFSAINNDEGSLNA